MSNVANGPRVSIITPTRNQARYIGACLDSIVGQTHENFESLIFDACSTDETAAVVARYRQDPRIKYLCEADTGPAEAINKGLDTATGEIVCWLNSDDAYFDRRALEKIVCVFRDHPDIDVVTGNGYYIDEDGRLLRPISMRHPREASFEGLRCVDTFLQPATFWRRNRLRLDPTLHYAFDWKLFLDMYRDGLSILYLPEYFAKYRLQPDSLTVADNAARKKEICEVLRYAGASPGQRLWAAAIHHSYAAAEALGFPPLKTLARNASRAVRVLTRGRIVSG